VLVLCGGDGLAVREALRYPDVQVTLVELDPAMIDLFSTHPELTDLNAGALSSPRLEIVNADAFVWLSESDDMFDFVAVDFPDPTSFSVGKLYTTSFYRLLAHHLTPSALVAVQATSPLFAPEAYWSIVTTLEEAGFATWPYHAYVPSFGEWGFVLAGKGSFEPPTRLPAGLRYLTPAEVPSLFSFPHDMARTDAVANRLDDQELVRTYEREWRRIER
jgi:spermidine synthase